MSLMMTSYHMMRKTIKKRAISTEDNRSISGEKCFPTQESLFVSFIVAITLKVSLIQEKKYQITFVKNIYILLANTIFSAQFERLSISPSAPIIEKTRTLQHPTVFALQLGLSDSQSHADSTSLQSIDSRPHKMTTGVGDDFPLSWWSVE